MIEAIVLRFLEERLSVPVYMELPERPPREYVIIEKTAGSEENYIASSTIAVQSYAESLYEAAVLNEKLKEAMDEILIREEICTCSLNTDYNFTDTATKKYRYQAVFDLVHY